MRRYLTLVIIWAVFSPGAQATEPNLTYRLDADHGRETRMQFTIINHGGREVWLLPWNTPLENVRTGNSLDVVCSGTKAKYSGAMVKRRAPTFKDYISIQPGGAVSASFFLKQGYKLPVHGSCTVQFRGTLDVKVMNDLPPHFVKPQGNVAILQLE